MVGRSLSILRKQWKHLPRQHLVDEEVSEVDSEVGSEVDHLVGTEEVSEAVSRAEVGDSGAVFKVVEEEEEGTVEIAEGSVEIAEGSVEIAEGSVGTEADTAAIVAVSVDEVGMEEIEVDSATGAVSAEEADFKGEVRIEVTAESEAEGMEVERLAVVSVVVVVVVAVDTGPSHFVWSSNANNDQCSSWRRFRSTRQRIQSRRSSWRRLQERSGRGRQRRQRWSRWWRECGRLRRPRSEADALLIAGRREDVPRVQVKYVTVLCMSMNDLRTG